MHDRINHSRYDLLQFRATSRWFIHYQAVHPVYVSDHAMIRGFRDGGLVNDGQYENLTGFSSNNAQTAPRSFALTVPRSFANFAIRTYHSDRREHVKLEFPKILKIRFRRKLHEMYTNAHAIAGTFSVRRARTNIARTKSSWVVSRVSSREF